VLGGHEKACALQCTQWLKCVRPFFKIIIVFVTLRFTAYYAEELRIVNFYIGEMFQLIQLKSVFLPFEILYAVVNPAQESFFTIRHNKSRV